jgi:hypothetical protein
MTSSSALAEEFRLTPEQADEIIAAALACSPTTREGLDLCDEAQAVSRAARCPNCVMFTGTDEGFREDERRQRKRIHALAAVRP